MRALPILGAAIVLAAFLLAFTVRIAAGSTVTTAICRTFGPRWCAQAVAVARCESGLHVYASNRGVYLGLFQLGPYARSRYGHSWDAYGQARAAYAYFRASGYRWTAWDRSCRP